MKFATIALKHCCGMNHLLHRQIIVRFLLALMYPEPTLTPNHFGATSTKSFPETIDICNEKYNELRRQLLMDGRRSADWVLGEFVASPDVSVVNREHFVQSVQSWKIDPCDSKT